MQNFEFEKTSDAPEAYDVAHQCDECDEAHRVAGVVRESPGVWRVTLDEDNLHVRRPPGSEAADFIVADTAEQMQEAFTNRFAAHMRNVGAVNQSGMRDYFGAQIDAAFDFAGRTGCIGGLVTALVEGLARGYLFIQDKPTPEEFVKAVTRRLDQDIARAVIVNDMREKLQEAVNEMMQSTRQSEPDEKTPIQ